MAIMCEECKCTIDRDTLACENGCKCCNKERVSPYEYELQGNYGYGWDILTTEETLKGAREQERTYRANEGGGVIYKIVRVRVSE